MTDEEYLKQLDEFVDATTKWIAKNASRLYKQQVDIITILLLKISMLKSWILSKNGKK